MMHTAAAPPSALPSPTPAIAIATTTAQQMATKAASIIQSGGSQEEATKAVMDAVPPAPTLLCHISQELMDKPVIAMDGHTYDEVQIRKWIQDNHTSPITRAQLTCDDLRPNRSIQSQIDEYKASVAHAVQIAVAAMTSSEGNGNMEGVESTSSNESDGGHVNDDDDEDAHNSPAFTIACPATFDHSSPPDDPRSNESTTHLCCMSLQLALQQSMQSSASGQPALVDMEPQPPHHAVAPSHDLVFVIDISGSMGTNAEIRTQTTREQSYLRIIDLVIHAIKAIIMATMVTPEQPTRHRIAIVVYSNDAHVKIPLAEVTPSTKDRVFRAMEALSPDGQTNIWSGLLKALEILKAVPEQAREGREQSIMVFTDGRPNISPARGEVSTLERYLRQNTIHPTITTFGFGTDVDSQLLQNMAACGNSLYGYINDTNAVQTVMCHVVAAVLMSINTRGTYMEMHLPNDLALIDPGNEWTPVEQGRYSRQIATMSIDQPKTITWRLNGTGDIRNVAIQVSATTDMGQTPSQIHTIRSNAPDDVVHLDVRAEHIRVEVPLILKRCLRPELTLEQRRQLIQDMVDHVEVLIHMIEQPSCAPSNTPPLIHAILTDLKGQMLLATSNQTYWLRWGEHYFRSMIDAYTQQTCTDFKNHAVQLFGGPYTKSLRDDLEDIFVGPNLPPPKPPTVVPPPFQYPSHPASTTRGMATMRGGGPIMRSGMRGGMRGGGDDDDSDGDSDMLGPGPIMRSMASGNSMPMPTPMQMQPPVNMRSFSSRDNPCFDEHALLEREDGSSVNIQELRKGDRVRVYPHDPKTITTIECMVETRCSQMLEMAIGTTPQCNLRITPWHPIQDTPHGSWIFPAQHPAFTMRETFVDTLFSIVTTNGRPILVNDCVCVSMGHTIANDPVATHPYLGGSGGHHGGLNTHRGGIYDDLQGLPGWKDGRIVMRAGWLRRDPTTHLISGIRTSHAVTHVTHAAEQRAYAHL